jgi:superfamily II DNA or RNA helicase
MHNFKGWGQVRTEIKELLKAANDTVLDSGQKASLRAIQKRLNTGQRALLLADEVGMGKTRIAAALIHAVKKSGGRTAVILPPNVGKQWLSEIQVFDQADKTLLPLRSYEGFIQGYAPEHSERTTERKERNRKARLQKKRQMRAIPDGRWHQENILLISHNFARMQFHQNASGHNWRRELLPAIATFLRGGKKHIRQNWGSPTLVEATHQIAREIVRHTDLPNLPNRDWRNISSVEYRNLLLPFIGRALGQFDLVIVDEAHKSRGQDSSLSRILGPGTWVQPDGFRMGMTATPVELDASQWINTLERVMGRDDAHCETERQSIRAELKQLESPIRAYSEIVKRLHTEPLDDPLVAEFERAASDFQRVLSPYVIRRDKRSDRTLADFKSEHGDYRDVKPIHVDPADASQCDASWLRRFCAAEALSMLPEAGRGGKLARLKLDKGLIYAADLGPEADNEPNERFWLTNLQAEPDDIYWHPAILKTVHKIEELAEKGHKTLVFATLTKPIQALNQLLDARAMLKALSSEKHWPASKVRAASESAVLSAMAQLDWNGVQSIKAINALLDAQYTAAHNKRSKQLDKIFRSLSPDTTNNPAIEVLFSFWNRAASEQRDRISEIVDAMRLICDVDTALENPKTFLRAFTDLLDTLKTAEDSEGEPALPDTLASRLKDHLDTFSSRESSFSRVMTGNTDPLTRYTLQEAFNRKDTWPMVLITQSLVGREGLNLHKACRHVILHAEWNPGILEQQIGRVDRKGSKWGQDITASGNQSGAAPRIEIYTVAVSGSYDQHQWDVVGERWRALRAQLHGEVFPIQDINTQTALRDCVRKHAPNFYPK